MSHEEDCCLKHGCFYGEDNCPVATGKLSQHKVFCVQCEAESRLPEWERIEDLWDMPERQIEKVNCLVCDKVLDYEPGPDYNGNVSDGGFMLVSFHYGSRHDQCHGFPMRQQLRGEKGTMENMLSCDEIEAFICDDCFEKKYAKMRGYDIHSRRSRTKIT